MGEQSSGGGGLRVSKHSIMADAKRRAIAKSRGPLIGWNVPPA